MDALLISPDHGNLKNNFPWGVLALGSYLSLKKQYQIKLMDASCYPYKKTFFEEIAIDCLKTKIIGIGFMSSDIYFVKEIIDFIKEKNPNCKIIAGGPHVVLMPEQTAQYKNIDFVAYDNGEETISRLIEEESSGKNYNAIPGIMYKAGKNIITSPPPKECHLFYETNYDLLPSSTRSTFNDYIQVITSRGCSYRCRFCYNSVIKQKFIPRPIHEIIDELDRVIEKYNPKIIYFRDENFFESKERIHKFIQYYHEKKYTFKWRATCRANYFSDKYVNFELLKELENINCEMLKFGFESGNQNVLNSISKGTKLEQYDRVIHDLAKVKKIRGSYSFMIGLPGEKYSEYLDTIRLVKKIAKYQPHAHFIGPQYFRIYPGGKLYDEIIEKYHFFAPQKFNEWAEITNPKFDASGFSKNINYPWIDKKNEMFTKYADKLMEMYLTPVKHYLKLKLLPALPFVLLAKLRVQNNYFKNMFEYILFKKIYHIYLKFFKNKKKREN